jgi:hypothetical protein
VERWKRKESDEGEEQGVLASWHSGNQICAYTATCLIGGANIEREHYLLRIYSGMAFLRHDLILLASISPQLSDFLTYVVVVIGH